MIIGCGPSKKQMIGGGKPWWIIEPPQSEHVLAAIGVSAETSDLVKMRKEAELDARIGIARILDLRVQEVIEVIKGRTLSCRIDDQEALDNYFESISRSILNMVIRGVRITKYYFDNDNRRLYAMATMDLRQTLPDLQKLVRIQTERNLSFPSPSEANAAFDQLDAGLKKIR